MKKLLAILLTLILTFSCFSLLGTGVALAVEKQQEGDIIMTSDFEDSTTTKWQSCIGGLTNISYNSETAADGSTDYFARVNSTSNGFMSAPFELVPGNEYELTFDIRIPEESNSYLYKGTTFYAPNFMLYETTASATTGKVTTTPNHLDADDNNLYSYAKRSRRSDFKSEWKIGDYDVINRTGESTLLYGNQKNLLGSTTDVKIAYANWTTVTVKFTAVADEDGETSQTTALAFNYIDLGNVADYLLDVKDVQLKCTVGNYGSKTIMQSDFDTSDGTNWVRSKTNLISYLDDNNDGTNDYAQITGTATLYSTTATLKPGNEYTLTYSIRIPKDSGSYNKYEVNGTTYKFAPKFMMYQPGSNAAGEKITTSGTTYTEGTNDYAYSSTSGTTRRSAFVADWQVGDYGSTTVTGYSLFNQNHIYKALIDADGNEISPNDAFADWTKITATFTAIDDEDNIGDQVVALAFGQPGGTSGLIYDIKDVTLTEKAPLINPEPDTTDAIFSEGFESSPNPTDVVTVYSGASQNATWVNPTITSSDAATGSKAYSAFAMYQDIFIPFDKSKLQADTVYSFSMDWMLNEYTSAKQRRINNVYAVGYTPTEGVTFKNGYEAFGGKGTVNGTGNWEALSFNFKITEDKFNKYEQIGIYIRYSTSGTDTDPDDRLYLDTLMLKVSENQDVVNELELNEADRTENTVKVLAFGNSFSNDGTSFIPQIAYADGVDLRVADCSIGGCTLKKHYNNSVTNASAYSFAFRTPQSQGTSSKSFTQVTMEQALTASDWDYITIQQVSTQSGDPDSFEPYLGKLIEKFKEYCPDAKIVFQMTWAYRDGIVKDGYEKYNNDQETMYNAIVNTYLQYAEMYDVEFIIPSGETIQSLRALISDGTGSETDTNMFSSEIASTTSDAGDFTRDGYHLSQKGRVAAAFTWYEIFTGISALDTKIDLTTSAYGTLSNTTDTLIGITEEEALAIKTAAHNAVSLYKKAVETIKAIKAIGEVTADSGEAIENAKALRAELNNDGLLPNLQTLIDAIEAFESLGTETILPGDFTGSGTVDLEDVTILAKLFAGWSVETVSTSLDLNGDGAENLKDLVLLAQYVAGWDVTLS